MSTFEQIVSYLVVILATWAFAEIIINHRIEQREFEKRMRARDAELDAAIEASKRKEEV